MDGAIGLGSTSAAVRAGFPVTGPREVDASGPARPPRAVAATPVSPPPAAASAPLADLADGASLTSRQFGLAIGPFALRYVSDRLDFGPTPAPRAGAASGPAAPDQPAGISTDTSPAAAASAGVRQASDESIARDAEFTRLLRDMARKKSSGRQSAASRPGEGAPSRSASGAANVRSFVAGETVGSSRAVRRHGVAAYQAQLTAPSLARPGAAFSLTV